MNTATLEDLPKIDADMLAAAGGAKPTAVAVVEPKAADLAKLDLTAVALAQFGDWRASLKATKDNLYTLVLDLSTAAKIKEARALRQRLIGDPLASARKASAGIKSKMAQTSKAVGAELEAIEAGYTEADALILPKIEAREQELEREREEKARLERERIARHQAAIARIRAYAEKADAEPGMTAARVAVAIGQIEAIPTPTKEAWDEFAVPAADAICWTMERLKLTRERLLRAEQAEAEAAELRRKLAEAEAARPKPSPEPINAPAAQDAPPQSVTTAQAVPTAEAGMRAAGAPFTVVPATAAVPLAPPPGSVVHTTTAEAHPGPIIMIDPSAPPADEKPTLKLGELNDWLAPIQINAAGLAELGISHSGTDKSAKLYRPSDRERIRLALIEHLEGLK